MSLCKRKVKELENSVKNSEGILNFITFTIIDHVKHCYCVLFCATQYRWSFLLLLLFNGLFGRLQHTQLYLKKNRKSIARQLQEMVDLKNTLLYRRYTIIL